MDFLTKQDIIDWIEQWFENNTSLKDNEMMEKFALELNEQMLKLDYRVSGNSEVIGYAGSITSGQNAGIYLSVERIVQNSNGDYCYINNCAENILNDDDFISVLQEHVGEENYKKLVWGSEVNGQYIHYSFGNALTLNDLVSDNFMLNNASGNVNLLITNSARVDSVLNVTEIIKNG